MSVPARAANLEAPRRISMGAASRPTFREEALTERLKQARVKFFEDLHDGIYGRTIYVADPDSNKVELYEEPR